MNTLWLRSVNCDERGLKHFALLGCRRRFHTFGQC
jgi:hypothetical protein